MSSVEIRVCGRYRLDSIVKRGDHKTLYLARNVQTNEDVVVKAEDSKARYSNIYTVLQEGKVLQSLQGGIGIPAMHWCGQEEDFNFIVMEQLGKNLEQYYNICNKRLSLKTVLMIGDQIIAILQYYHFKNYVHRGVNPSNFLMGLGKKNHKVFMIDYSTTKKFRDPKTLEHTPLKEYGFNPDNIMFSGISANSGVEASRRDDIESLILMLVYLLKGLPWSQYLTEEANYRTKDETILQTIYKMKKDTAPEEVCKGLPKEFTILLKYSRSLAFEEKPDYIYIKNIFRERLERQGYINDSIYDWVLLQPDPVTLQNPLYIPLNLEIIPNEEEFIKANLEMYTKEIEENNENQQVDRPEQIKQPTVVAETKPPIKKDKECSIF